MTAQPTAEIEQLELNEASIEEVNTAYGFNVENKKDVKPRSITLKLILERNLNIESRENFKNEYMNKIDFNNADLIETEEDKSLDKAELKANQLLKLTHIHLDREQIGEIDNLSEYLGEVTNLYLQCNLIRRIENLEFLYKLKFLVLSNNQIRHIENLLGLKQLKLLDLSYNLIDEFDVKELPKCLAFLDLRENECLTGPNQTWSTRNYTNLIMNHLHELKQLNGEDLSSQSDEETSGGEENDNQANDRELFSQIDSFKMLSERIIERSRQRQIDDAVHLNERSQLNKLRMEEARQSFDKNLKSTKKNYK